MTFKKEKYFQKDKNSAKARVQYVVEQSYNTVSVSWHFKTKVCYEYHDPVPGWLAGDSYTDFSGYCGPNWETSSSDHQTRVVQFCNAFYYIRFVSAALSCQGDLCSWALLIAGTLNDSNKNLSVRVTQRGCGLRWWNKVAVEQDGKSSKAKAARV